jgi:hypothetical protein
MAIVVVSVLITFMFIALFGLSLQVVLLKQLVENANQAIKDLEGRHQAAPERPAVAILEPVTAPQAELAAV